MKGFGNAFMDRELHMCGGLLRKPEPIEFESGSSRIVSYRIFRP